MNKTHTLTLSRWHKVAERLSREYTETVFKGKQALTQTRVSAYVGDSQEQALREQASDWSARLERAFRLQDGIGDIRRVLGDANAHHGITALLAEFDKLNRRQKVLTELVEGQTPDMIAIDELTGDFSSDEEGGRRGRGGRTRGRSPARERAPKADAKPKREAVARESQPVQEIAPVRAE